MNEAPPLPGRVDTRDWQALIRSDHGVVWLADHGVLVTVPYPGTVQTEGIARTQLDRLYQAVRDHGRPCGNIVFVDPVLTQDAGARRMWATEIDPNLIYGLGLVCSSLLARAIGSFFIGIRRPVIPTRMFASFESTFDWMRELRDHAPEGLPP